jgi:hypothetical protein
LRCRFGIINWRSEEIHKSTGTLERYQKYMNNLPESWHTWAICEKERRRKRLVINWNDKAEVINITEHLNTNYKEDQFVNIVWS